MEREVDEVEKLAGKLESGDMGAAVEPRLSPEAQDVIAKRLRTAYAEMLSAPMPERFTQLLDELARSEKQDVKQDE